MDKAKSHLSANETKPGEKSAAGTIHVSWNGASEVRDLNEYFGDSQNVREHLDFLDWLDRRLNQMPEP